MVQNLKVDIIYHLTQSDFEMEFNLCGCCPTRLLNDKTTDQKTFVKALSRAVSRSRVIIVCGPLFNAEGLIKTVAAAIGSGTCLCNNTAYGINEETPIEIINGSTPLVTPDGYFGGCIIESGPQTIIVLTENRGFRKTIMQNLIHPYIEEISYIPTKTSEIKPALTQEPQMVALVPDENYITVPDVDYDAEQNVEESTVEVSADEEHIIDFIMDEPDKTEDDEQSAEPLSTTDEFVDIMYTQVESEEEIKERYEHPYISSESDNMFIATAERDETELPRNSKDKTKVMDIAIVILILLVLLAILALVYLVVLKPYNMGISTGDYLKEIFGLANSSSLL